MSSPATDVEQARSAAYAMRMTVLKQQYPSADAMTNLTMTWGQHKGKTFSNVLLEDFSYVLWFLQLPVISLNGEQIKFRHYLNLMMVECVDEDTRSLSGGWEQVDQPASSYDDSRWLAMEERLTKVEEQLNSIVDQLRNLQL